MPRRKQVSFDIDTNVAKKIFGEQIMIEMYGRQSERAVFLIVKNVMRHRIKKKLSCEHMAAVIQK